VAIDERDPHTGHKTTGHEWNGIKELNTPVPKAVWFFLILTGLFSVGYWILMPAWPTGRSYTPGLLGRSDSQRVFLQREASTLARADWYKQLETMSYAQLLADPVAMTRVRSEGARLFGDNCAACHGRDGRGGLGFPSFADRDWLWGGSPETVAETIRVGINATHPDTRVSEMIAFGAGGILDSTQVGNATDYVQSLSDPAVAKARPNSVLAGRVVFEANCVPCHGSDARGNQSLGVPNLTDHAWIAGHDWAAIHTTISGGRKGEMPSWEGRLSPAERKLLTLYVLDLSSGAQ
jgi:cytochrome c oxidase cbb3-type subunit 3